MGKRERVKGKPKAWATRGKNGQFQNWTNIKRSLAADKRKSAKTKVKSGYGHQGDHNINDNEDWKSIFKFDIF